MCIIAIKPKGVQRPTDAMFMSMCAQNSNGFGMVYWTKSNGLTVRKTMDENEYMEWVSQIGEDTPAIFHMRIATHGSINVKNCHPFISKKRDWAFAHNGILSIQNEKDMTDSETFFRRIAMPMIQAGYLPNTTTFDAMVQTIIGSSKFAFMDNKGKIYTYGDYINEGGLLFSNSTYQSLYTPFSKYGYGQSCYQDDVDCCFADLYNELSYSNYYEGLSDNDLYDYFGRAYGLSRKAFKGVLKNVKEAMGYSDDNDKYEILSDY